MKSTKLIITLSIASEKDAICCKTKVKAEEFKGPNELNRYYTRNKNKFTKQINFKREPKYYSMKQRQ